MEGVRRRFALRAAQHGVEIEIEDAGDQRAEADPLRLEQALGNLVDNALRHGGGTVRLRAHAGPDTVVLHVRDDGPGFSDGFAAYAFERFTREDPARGRGGAGLGLAIVEAIARAHGGSVRATNAPGGGADVAIELPALSPAPVAPVPL
jgi:signal transduction histidine kinase